MTHPPTAVEAPDRRLPADKARVAALREESARMLRGGAAGVETAATLARGVDELLIGLFRRNLAGFDPRKRESVERHGAVVAVGGTGRGELCPHSDVDLLFVHRGRGQALRPFSQLVGQVVRDCWDAGLKVGHSLRTISETVHLARNDPQVATSLVEARRLCGDGDLFEMLRQRIERGVVGSRVRAFIEAAIEARRHEQFLHGATAQCLEPDVKRSLGGLRDLHLVRWIGFARYGSTDFEALRQRGGLTDDDAAALQQAHEFLTRVRIDLHLAAGRPQDVLNRHEQLRIAEQRGIAAAAGRRPVERFMQEYFRHSMAVAEVVRRFVARHRPHSLGAQVARTVISRRVDGMFRVGRGTIDVLPRHRDSVCGRLDQILRLYHAALLYEADLVPELVERIRQAAPGLSSDLSPESARMFLDILAGSVRLGPVLREMYDTGLLELIVPPMRHARCLLQFNQYHSYTVDEHTLRAIEAVEEFQRDAGPVGTAYRAVRHREVLHLALLLHDLGKGYEEDHSEVGRRIAEEMAGRLFLGDHQREALVFLVHKHLLMSHLAFRRDLSDPAVVLDFARQVGSPETLRMLFVLTAADLKAVGPNVWTDWKAELLTELFEQTLQILGGRSAPRHDAQRLHEIRDEVRERLAPAGAARDSGLDEWLDRQLEAFAPTYLTATPPARIAADLRIIRDLSPGEVVVEGRNEPETGTVEYRILTHAALSDGCFHKIAGALTAHRLDILAAQITTSLEGTVVDSFRVLDGDFAGEAPPHRIDEVADSIRGVLTGRTTVKQLFQRRRRFGAQRPPAPTSNLPTRVSIDNHTSDRCTIVDVFAHDRTGLLYTITRTLYELGLSVMLAKIATHFDQVLDVFYVTDAAGGKIEDHDRLQAIQQRLTDRLEQFERQEHLEFVSGG